MKVIDTLTLTLEQKENILQLWNQEYPEQLKHHNLADFEKYLDNLADKEYYLLTGDTN